MSEFLEFSRGPWRLRAALVEDAKVKGMEGYADDEPMDLFIWFVGRFDEDEWLAHGLSDHADDDAADKIYESIDGEQMDVWLAYAGVDWSSMANGYDEFAVTQRALVNDIHPKMMEDMLAMSRSEIRTLREAEENATPWGRPNSMN
jgi:hypothetical protein